MHDAEQEIQALIDGGESLAVEFKSDVKSLPDRDLVAAVVALANTEGGDKRSDVAELCHVSPV